MAKKSKNGGDELVLIAKAIRRGEKLERTLTNLVALKDPQSHVEAFLKAVQKGLEKLRKEPTAFGSDDKPSRNKTKTVERLNMSEVSAAPVVVKRVRKSGKPAAIRPEQSASNEPAMALQDLALKREAKK